MKRTPSVASNPAAAKLCWPGQLPGGGSRPPTQHGQRAGPGRGSEERGVNPDQPVQSISAEDTFAQDVPLGEVEPMIRTLAGKTWAASRKTERVGRTVVLKLKTADFHILTRSHTPPAPPQSEQELADMAVALRERVALPAHSRYRWVGVGLSNFCFAGEGVCQAELFV